MYALDTKQASLSVSNYYTDLTANWVVYRFVVALLLFDELNRSRQENRIHLAPLIRPVTSAKDTITFYTYRETFMN